MENKEMVDFLTYAENRLRLLSAVLSCRGSGFCFKSSSDADIKDEVIDLVVDNLQYLAADMRAVCVGSSLICLGTSF